MSEKYSAARKKAFLKALSTSGNQTLSAERVKVSRSWVRLHRSIDAAFDTAVRAAIEAAKVALRERASTDAALGRRGTNRPPSGWGFANGVELVVSGSRGRRTQVRRAKCGGWTRRTEQKFLIALSESCNVKAAVRSAGMSQSSAYAHRHRWPAFAREWDEAVAIGYAALEAALIEGANAFFERAPLELGGPIRPTSVGEAIQVLTMNRRAVTGFAKGRA